MRSDCFEPVTVAEIRVLVASLYEPHPRIWKHKRWECPNCLKEDANSAKQCGCGISRDGLPEFCEHDRSPFSATLLGIPAETRMMCIYLGDYGCVEAQCQALPPAPR